MLKKLYFVKIAKKNPVLMLKPELRKLLVRRRIVHKMFDMIKCEAWKTLIETKKLQEHKYLLLRDCYLTLDLMCTPDRLEEILNDFYNVFKHHLEKCRKCFYKGEMCKICMNKKDLIFIYDVSKVSKCKHSLKVGHKRCV